MAGTLRDTRGYASVELEIKNFSQLGSRQIIVSTPFLLSDSKYKIRLFPSLIYNLDRTEMSETSIDLDLIKQRLPSPGQNCIYCTFGIKASDGSVYKSLRKKFNFEYVNLGMCHDFIDRSELFEMKDVLLPQDTLTIFIVARLVEGNGVETASQTVSPKGFTALIENLRELYYKENFDVKINVKGREFQAHRSILAARSPLFASILFEKDMAEKRSGDVEITDCDANSFGDFLLYLYTGQMGRVSPANVFDIYRTADKFVVKELRAKCAQYMACDLSVDSFCDAYLIAVIHNEAELFESVTEFFIENVKTILPTLKWQFFMKNHHSLADQLVMKVIDRI